MCSYEIQQGVSLTVFGCAGSSDDDSQSDDQDLTKSCAPAMTLECKKGYVSSTDGCTSGHAKCIVDPTGKTCGGFGGLACPSGYDCELAGDFPDAPGTCQKASSEDAGTSSIPDDVPTCLTLTCAPDYHCCAGIAAAPGSKPYPATCQATGSSCPM